MTRDVEATRTVRGEIVLPDEGITARVGDIVVQIEDVSRADARSVVVAEQRRHRVPLHGGAVIPFVVGVPAELLDDRASYSVRVHIDVSGSGDVEVGDLVSIQSYPVLTRGHADQAQVQVQSV